MGVADPPLPELAGGSRGLPAPLGTSWGSEVDLTDASQPLELTQPDAIEASLLEEPDEAEGGYSESGGESISLGSDVDEDDDFFFPQHRVAYGGGRGVHRLPEPGRQHGPPRGLQEGGCAAEPRVARAPGGDRHISLRGQATPKGEDLDQLATSGLSRVPG